MWKVGSLKHCMTPFHRDRRRVPPGLVFEQPSRSFSILACPGPARGPLYNKNYNLVGFGVKNNIKVKKRNNQNRHLFARNRRFCRGKPAGGPPVGSTTLVGRATGEAEGRLLGRLIWLGCLACFALARLSWSCLAVCLALPCLCCQQAS